MESEHEADHEPANSPLSPLTAELTALAGITWPPSADDTEHVRRWLAAGITPDRMRAVIVDKRPRAKKSIGKLSYFHSPMVELDTRPAAAPQTSPPPPAVPALSAEDRALHERLAPSHKAGWERRDACPKGASPEAWKEALAAGKGALAERWLAVWTAWNAAGEPQDCKPPNFGMWKLQPGLFAKCLEDVEEMLTGPEPDPPQAAAD